MKIVQFEAAALEVSPQDFLGWARSPESGKPVLVIIAGSRRVMLECEPVEAKELSCGGIFAAGLCVFEAQQKAGNPGGVAAGLVDGRGMPLRAAGP